MGRFLDGGYSVEEIWDDTRDGTREDDSEARRLEEERLAKERALDLERRVREKTPVDFVQSESCLSRYDLDMVLQVHGSRATPALLQLIESPQRNEYIKFHAAVKLRSHMDQDTERRLMELLYSPSCAYAVIGLPLARVADFLLDDLQDSGVKSGIFKTILEQSYHDLNTNNKVEIAPGNASSRSLAVDKGVITLAEHLIEKGGPGEPVFEGLFCFDPASPDSPKPIDAWLGSLPGTTINYLFSVSRAGQREMDARVRALSLVGESGPYWLRRDECRDVKRYLGNAASLILGRWTEPEKSLRLVARTAYAKIK